MNKIIIGFAAAILVLVGIIWIAYPNNSQNNNTANVSDGLSRVIEVSEKNFDFGEISMAAGNVNHSFTIKNIGSGPMVINKMYTSCMCTTAILKVNGKTFGPYGMQGHGPIPKIGKELGSGQEAVVEVTFDPAAHGPAGVGAIQRVIYVENNAGAPLQLSFTANVKP